MANPYRVLNVNPSDTDETIRRHYLDAVRRFPPDRSPEEFQRIREAYDKIKTEENRLAFLLFEPSQGETIDELLQDEQCRRGRKRVGLAALLSILNEMS